jgi:hypothetical protein
MCNKIICQIIPTDRYNVPNFFIPLPDLPYDRYVSFVELFVLKKWRIVTIYPMKYFLYPEIHLAISIRFLAIYVEHEGDGLMKDSDIFQCIDCLGQSSFCIRGKSGNLKHKHNIVL